MTADLHWLSHSQGFRIDASGGRVGVVEDVLFRSRPDCPDLLVVRAGRCGRTLLVVSVENVEEVIPGEKRIVLQGSPRLSGPEPRADGWRPR